MPKMLDQLVGVRRCPHCSVATPTLQRVWASHDGYGTPRSDGQQHRAWCCYLCTSCGGAVTARGYGKGINQDAEAIFPRSKEAHVDIPPTPRTFLQQAYETLYAPDASAVMAGSAVDAMLKHFGHTDGSLYKRIDEALEARLLTKGMADWAHSVRLGSNRPRHADENNPHVTGEEAQRSVDFAEALGNFLFVLTKQIDDGIAAANKPE